MTPTKPLDLEAARADLRGRIATNDAALAKVRDKLGALALDVTLGNAAQSEVDAAHAECARLQSNAEALTQALAEVDKREAAQQEQDAAAARKADEAERERLMAVVKAASAKAADLVGKLADVATEAVEAEAGALRIARRLDITQRAMVAADLMTVFVARMGKALPSEVPWQRPVVGEEAEARLRAV